MQLIGQAIRHETFGKGIVTGWDRNILTVCFPGGDKRFLYPDAFARHHLTLWDQGMQDQIQAVLRARETEKREAQQAVQEEQERTGALAAREDLKNVSSGVRCGRRCAESALL